MPTAPNFEWPQGNPLFEVQWRAITESLAGNGILSNSDFEITGTANTREIDISSGTVYYLATEYSFGGSVKQISVGDSTYDRWDTVYFDTGTTSVGVREGTPEQYPEPPDISGNELLLGILYIPQDFDSPFPSGQILNWRAKFSNESEEVHYDDATGVYGINNVNAALDELQEAAQISSYPLSIGDLNNPYGLSVITDMDVSGTDLVDSSTVLYESSSGYFRNEVVEALVNFTNDGQFTSYPLPIGDLNYPFSLPVVTDMDVNGTDLVDSGTTIWDTSTGSVPREQIDDRKLATELVASGSLGSYITSDNEVILVDTATNSTSFTVTLSSSDNVLGNTFVVSDAGGASELYPITIETEGSESINGQTSVLIENDYGTSVFLSDGTEWYKIGESNLKQGIAVEDDSSQVLLSSTGINFAGGLGVTDDTDGTVSVGYEHKNVFEGRESGEVTTGNQGILIVDHLSASEKAQIFKAVLINADGTAVPTGCDLNLVTLDNAGGFTSRDTIVAGDGSTIYDDESGSPLSSYTNSSGSGQTIGVIVDNQSGGAVNIMASCEGVTE